MILLFINHCKYHLIKLISCIQKQNKEINSILTQYGFYNIHKLNYLTW